MNLLLPKSRPPLPYAGESVHARDMRDVYQSLQDAGTPVLDSEDVSRRLDTPMLYFQVLAQGVPGDGILKCKLVTDQQSTPNEYDVLVPETFYETDREGITYTYTDVNTRTANPGAHTELLTPKYLVADVIIALFLRGVWRDLNIDGRQWGRT